ncbi:hypothetical protein BTVI_88044 [Pitangus sulphuratus]|nr:hypothetical protein BTVI_88044 [Pitangus sulphuratus]
MFQHLKVPLAVGIQTVQPHQQCQVQRDNHFPGPAGLTLPDTSQDAIGLLGHLGTLLAQFSRLSTSTLCPFPPGRFPAAFPQACSVVWIGKKLGYIEAPFICFALGLISEAMMKQKMGETSVMDQTALIHMKAVLQGTEDCVSLRITFIITQVQENRAVSIPDIDFFILLYPQLRYWNYTGIWTVGLISVCVGKGKFQSEHVPDQAEDEVTGLLIFGKA